MQSFAKKSWQNCSAPPLVSQKRPEALPCANTPILPRWAAVQEVKPLRSGSLCLSVLGCAAPAEDCGSRCAAFLNWLHNCQHRVRVSFFLQCSYYLLWGPLSAHIQLVCRQKLPAGNELWLKLRCWATVQALSETRLLCIQVSELSGTDFTVVWIKSSSDWFTEKLCLPSRPCLALRLLKN